MKTDRFAAPARGREYRVPKSDGKPDRPKYSASSLIRCAPKTGLAQLLDRRLADACGAIQVRGFFAEFRREDLMRNDVLPSFRRVIAVPRSGLVVPGCMVTPGVCGPLKVVATWICLHECRLSTYADARLFLAGRVGHCVGELAGLAGCIHVDIVVATCGSDHQHFAAVPVVHRERRTSRSGGRRRRKQA